LTRTHSSRGTARQPIAQPLIKAAGCGIVSLHARFRRRHVAAVDQAFGRADQTGAQTRALKRRHHPHRPQQSTPFGPTFPEVDPDLTSGKAVDIGDQHGGIAAHLPVKGGADDVPVRREQAEPFEMRQVGLDTEPDRHLERQHQPLDHTAPSTASPTRR
jgi:hypothetical protein